jgi:hypothetical protein
LTTLPPLARPSLRIRPAGYALTLLPPLARNHTVGRDQTGSRDLDGPVSTALARFDPLSRREAVRWRHSSEFRVHGRPGMTALADRHWAAMRPTRAYELTPHARHGIPRENVVAIVRTHVFESDHALDRQQAHRRIGRPSLSWASAAPAGRVQGRRRRHERPKGAIEQQRWPERWRS